VGSCQGRPRTGAFILTLDSPHVTDNRAGNEAQRSSVGLRSLVDSVFSSYWHAFRNASELSASIIPVRSQKYIDRRFVPLRFSRSCLRPPLLPGFYPHSQGATLGPVHVGVRSQTRPHHNRDGAWLVGCCHLIGDLQGSGDFPQSPEQGEWMSLLQTFPITNRPPRHQRIFCSLDSCLFAIASVNYYGTWLAGLCSRRLSCPGFYPRVM
jgi:hypothetical protein